LLYVAGIVILLDQAADLASTLLTRPLEPAAPAWRFGAFGLLMARVSALVLADAMILTAAIQLGHRKVLRVLGALHLLLALALLGVIAFFLLDAVQLRRGLRPEVRQSFELAALRALLVTGLMVVLAGWVGLASLRVTRGRRERTPEQPFIAVRHGSAEP
jgi:hypothetical protein